MCNTIYVTVNMVGFYLNQATKRPGNNIGFCSIEYICCCCGCCCGCRIHCENDDGDDDDNDGIGTIKTKSNVNKN